MMKVNNKEKMGAKVGWEWRRGCAELRETEERKGGRLNTCTVIVGTHMQTFL